MLLARVGVESVDVEQACAGASLARDDGQGAGSCGAHPQ